MGTFIVILCLFAIAKAMPASSQQQIPDKSKQQKLQQQINQNDQTASATNYALEKDSQFAATSILDNPSYDPSLYSSFIPQDAIQQYVNQFGGPFAPYAGGSFPSTAPFAVQTGYEGFLVPDVQSVGESLYSGPLTFFRGIVPKVIVAWLVKSAAVILSTFGVIFFGGAITTALCTLTPLCSITFNALPSFKWKQTAEAVGKAIGTELTPDRIRRAVQFLSAAIDKYTELQQQQIQQNGVHDNETYGGTGSVQPK